MKLLNVTEITKKIETVAKTGASFQNAVQLTAVSIVAHMAKSRDTTLIERLYDAMPAGTRRKGMADWLNKHCSDGFELSYKGKKLDVSLADKDSADWNKFTQTIDKTIKTLQDNVWWLDKAERGTQDAVSLDVIIAYLEKKNKNAPAKTADQIGQVVEFAKALKAKAA